MHEVIFEADTAVGKAFDVALLWCIVLSVLAVLLESVPSIRDRYEWPLRAVEWLFTILFTIEYILRILSVGRPTRYIISFFGIVDLLAIVPTYLSLVLPGAQTLLVIRALRLLRIFRVLKLVRFLNEARMLSRALRESRHKITVFLGTVLILVLIIGTLMHLIEGEHNEGFNSIPGAVYWSIVTLTTVGYGDIAPHTIPGKALASIVMIMGYSIIAVPTGIVTVALARSSQKPVSTQACPQCAAEGHDADAKHCKYCGARL
ncbi:MAG: ion transporter [Planctomycetota bacterium]